MHNLKILNLNFEKVCEVIISTQDQDKIGVCTDTNFKTDNPWDLWYSLTKVGCFSKKKPCDCRHFVLIIVGTEQQEGTRRLNNLLCYMKVRNMITLKK